MDDKVPEFIDEMGGNYYSSREKTQDEIKREIRHKISNIKLDLKELVRLGFTTEEYALLILNLLGEEQ